MLEKGAHIHLMRICGTAMASLAGMLKDMGYRISGSDQNVYPPMSTQLRDLGIPIMEGYRKENLSPRPDLVIVGNVITRKHEEAEALLASDIPYTSLPKALGEYAIADRHSVVIAGTHGKTTTTSLVSWIAECCGKKPGFLVGGIPLNFSRSFRAPEGDWFVIEGDEYDTAFFDKVPKFIHYKPKYVVLTSVEFDHADIYNSLEDVEKAFYMLMDLIPEDGLLVVNGEDPIAMKMTQKCKARVVTYGLEKGDYQVASRQVLVGRNQFAIVHNDKRIVDLAIKQFGPHNTL
ncbi:MAG: UDP-N-acetylmuramate:L-alanyl-gamma-D-glutamyl-meso-diaminopimelate ligase, partial [Bdellovibrionales bacterium]|nr:UDP-N-acetylmuramate:L-alanyl-gamma-D-glutamyl-meso-diaminopimelate ligase [Bdellovibrionales bacterium]